MVKLDLDTLLTVPNAPPAAGPDRALDPPPRAMVEEDAVVADEGAADTEDEARPTESPVAAHISAAATIRPRRVFDRDCRTSCGCWCRVAERIITGSLVDRCQSVSEV